MRQGKLPEIVFSRSADKKIRAHNNRLKGAAAGPDCAFLCVEGTELGDNSEAYAEEIEKLFRYAFYKAAAVAGKPAWVQAQMVLPEECGETDLRQLITILTDQAEQYGLLISDADIRTSAHADRIFINIVLMGHLDDAGNLLFRGKKKAAARQLVYVGRAGSAGTSALAEKYRAQLCKRYSTDYAERMAGVYDEVKAMADIPGAASKTADTGKTAAAAGYDRFVADAAAEHNGRIVPVGEGGVFAALWEVGKEYGCGLRVDLKAIPVFQETVELCDFFDINPYMLESSGDCIIICEDADGLVSEFAAKNVEASHIGFLTDGNDRVIINNDEERFLTAPEQDVIFAAEEQIKKAGWAE